MIKVGPTRGDIRDQIVADVLLRHGITKEELRGPGRTYPMVAARIEISERLRQAQFGAVAIARIINRDHTVVLYYFSKERQENHKARERLRAVLRYQLPDDVQATIKAIAAERGNQHPTHLMTEWLIERARFEAESRARAVA